VHQIGLMPTFGSRFRSGLAVSDLAVSNLRHWQQKRGGHAQPKRMTKSKQTNWEFSLVFSGKSKKTNELRALYHTAMYRQGQRHSAIAMPNVAETELLEFESQ
jgi:hypothetical protein